MVYLLSDYNLSTTMTTALHDNDLFLGKVSLSSRTKILLVLFMYDWAPVLRLVLRKMGFSSRKIHFPTTRQTE